jgi:hypothetical protein
VHNAAFALPGYALAVVEKAIAEGSREMAAKPRRGKGNANHKDEPA